MAIVSFVSTFIFIIKNIIFEEKHNHLMHQFDFSRYKCYSCEPPDCADTTIHAHHCQNAIQCWKSRTRDQNGNENLQRGCTNEHDQLPLYCSQNQKSSTGGGPKKRHVSGSGMYNIECCTGDYCNNGSFPSLPPMKGMLVRCGGMKHSFLSAFFLHSQRPTIFRKQIQ